MTDRQQAFTTTWEVEMFGYEFLTSQGVVTVEASSISEALSLVESGAKLLCTIDRKPQVFLAW